MRKLTTAKVSEIKELIAAGKANVQIARLFGVTRDCIRKIRIGKSWVKPDGRPASDAHCRNGHFRTKMCTYIRPDGRRECKYCKNASDKRRRDRTIANDRNRSHQLLEKLLLEAQPLLRSRNNET